MSERDWDEVDGETQGVDSRDEEHSVICNEYDVGG